MKGAALQPGHGAPHAVHGGLALAAGRAIRPAPRYGLILQRSVHHDSSAQAAAAGGPRPSRWGGGCGLAEGQGFAQNLA